MPRLVPIAGVAVLLALLAMPAGASAATADLNTASGILTVTGDDSAEAIWVSGESSMPENWTHVLIGAPGITDADDAGTACTLSGTTLTCDGAVVYRIVVNAGDGADTLTGGSLRPLEFNGEAGDDTFDSSSVTAADAHPTQNGGAGDDLFVGVGGSAFGGVGNDEFVGVRGHAFGEAGDDVISGALGVIDGGEGNDTLNAWNGSFSSEDTGGAGNDTLNGDPHGRDAFDAEPGADTYIGGNVCIPFQLSDGSPWDQPWDAPTGCSEDSVSYGDRKGPIAVTFDNVANDGAAGEGDNIRSDITSVEAGGGNDTLDASMAATGKWLAGGAGNDVVTGGPGPDALSGGNGSDTVNGGPGDDELTAQEWSSSGGSTEDQPGDDSYVGGAGDDHLWANSTVWSGSGTVYQEGSLGADVFSGGDGADEIYVERIEHTNRPPAPADGLSPRTVYPQVLVTLDGVANDGFPGSTFTLAADFENVTTGNGDDTIVGNGGSNVLSGGGGRDAIDGGAGVDLIYGDNGADRITSRDQGFDKVDCGLAHDAPVQADAGDLLHDCELSFLTPLPAPPDVTKPTSKLKAPKKIKAASLAKSRTIALEVTPSEAAILEATVYSGRAGGAVGAKVLGKGRAGLKVGKRKIKVKLSRSVANALARQARARGKQGIVVTVSITTTDAAGLSSRASVTIRIVR